MAGQDRKISVMGALIRVRYLIACMAVLLTSTDALVSQKNKRWFYGGSVGMVLPSNMGEKEFDIGFANVSRSGPKISFDVRWFYNERLALGGELSVCSFPESRGFWNVGRYGNVDAGYSMGQSSVHGLLFFGDDDIMPYIAMGFGAYYLSNRLKFLSAYTGTNADASIEYKTSHVKPGYTPQVGFMVRVPKRRFFYVDIRFQIVPNIKPTAVYFYDTFGYVIDTAVQNAHGHQNHWVFSAGFLW
jgi:hypothetical protein